MSKRELERDKEFIDKLESHTDFDKDTQMKKYEEETGKYAIWRGVVTEGFKRWVRGEKIYDRNKERISLYVSEETKNIWQEFLDQNNLSTLSKLIRMSVKSFINKYSNSSDDISKLNPSNVSRISHALKEPLTSIKGYAQLILENYKDHLSEQIYSTIRNIFDQSILLENKIIQFLDNIRIQTKSYDILLIEDDVATIKLITSYFESKGLICKGVVGGTKGLQELKNLKPKIILLDIILPDLDGYDICKIIKNDKEFSNIPVYFLTAIAGLEVEKKLDTTGADGYILKPFNFSDFEPILEYIRKSKEV